MTRHSERENLKRVKLALADKYESLANRASSRVKREQFLHMVERYRRQATTFVA
jgi:hypothetical protein